MNLQIMAGTSYAKYYTQEKNTELLKWCNWPFFILCLAGPWMCVLEAVYVEKPIVDLLMDLIPLIPTNIRDYTERETGLLARIMELEQSAKENENNRKLRDTEINELRSRISKLEQMQSQTDEKNNFIVKSDDDAKEINQFSIIPKASVLLTLIFRNTELRKSEILARVPLLKNSYRKKGAKNISQMISDGNLLFTPQIAPAEVENHNNYDEVYYNDEVCFDNPTSHYNNDSEEERLNESDNDRYNGYDRYDEYGRCNRGYYYCDRRYERKSSPMISSIILPVTA
ncbi:4461_t:CDS:2 [Dentiscutata heterogama]|uniref:4461_t:CDS:1 n=1 Tax=Dentiscutata heterogama TaxID=1316150 RepID=A0ACA9LFJ4_9GLOM|nr:4461_t:CDS:2 [Dentiscutata heterogama]